METIKNLINIKKDRIGLVICAGSSVKENKKQIDQFIKEKNPVTIGINNISHLYKPEYHLWTNTKRFRNFGHKTHNDSKLLLGSNISIKVIKEVIGNRKYTLINYTDQEGIPIGYKKGKIYGHYRTAGCLAIMILHLMGVSKINIVGMDGHTIHEYEDIKSGKIQHHCYEENYIPYLEDMCIKKDKLIDKILNSLKNYGINFKILNPTIYENFKGGF